jgi:hypothetical protein
LEVNGRAGHARHVIAGFSLVIPTLADLWRQVDAALSDVPALSIEIARLRAQCAASRLDRANLAAAARVTIGAYLDHEANPLHYLRDELRAQGFDAERGQG